MEPQLLHFRPLAAYPLMSVGSRQHMHRTRAPRQERQAPSRETSLCGASRSRVGSNIGTGTLRPAL